MKKALQVILILAILAGAGIIIGQKSVWASPPAPIDVTGDPETGTGPYELGGCVTGNVNNLKDGFKLNVSMLDTWNSYRIQGLPPMPMFYWTLPGGPDDIFSCVVTLKIMENDTQQKEFKADKGTAEVCLDTPEDKEGSIYFYDQFKYFGEYPSWVKVGGPYPGASKGCVPVTYSGVYAYYSPEQDKDLNDPNKFTTEVVTQRVGSVDVPTTQTKLASNGPLALGGCVTGNIEDLKDGYVMDAALLTTWDGVKPLPEKVGEFYECVLDVKFNENDKMIQELPEPDGNTTICFAIPLDKVGVIYFLDKYYDDEAEWVPVSEQFESGIACGPVTKSGYYGMVDVQVNP